MSGSPSPPRCRKDRLPLRPSPHPSAFLLLRRHFTAGRNGPLDSGEKDAEKNLSLRSSGNIMFEITSNALNEPASAPIQCCADETRAAGDGQIVDSEEEASKTTHQGNAEPIGARADYRAMRRTFSPCV